MEEYKKNQNVALALGFFDGVHKAHRKILKHITEQKKYGLTPTVLTFSQDESLSSIKRDYIFSYRQRVEQFYANGVENIFASNFFDIKDYEPEEFFSEVILNQLNTKYISCGYDYRFGKFAKGDVNLLKKLSKAAGVTLFILERYHINDETVSSSKIKSYLLKGNIKSASDMLGFEYYIKNTVVSGRKLGNTIGFPTINQEFDIGQLVPRYGVYITTTILEDKEYKSITNIGVSPTIEGTRNPIVETYILDFDGDLYGKDVKVIFHDFLREEEKFSSIDELKSVLLLDKMERIKYDK